MSVKQQTARKEGARREREKKDRETPIANVKEIDHQTKRHHSPPPPPNKKEEIPKKIFST